MGTTHEYGSFLYEVTHELSPQGEDRRKVGKEISGKRTSKTEYSSCLNIETELFSFQSTSLLPTKERNANISPLFLGRFKD